MVKKLLLSSLDLVPGKKKTKLEAKKPRGIWRRAKRKKKNAWKSYFLESFEARQDILGVQFRRYGHC